MSKLLCSASVERQKKKEEEYYLKNGSSVLEELLALCNGNCRIPIRYFSAIEIKNAIDLSAKKIQLDEGYMVKGSLENRMVLIRFSLHSYGVHRDIAVTAQMSHLKNVLKLIGCCLEFEEPVMVYEHVVEGIRLNELLFNKGNANTNGHNARKSLSWGSRLRIACEIASAIVFLRTEFTTPIIHRDIKPSKVIIDQNNGVAKIVDFSFSISLPPGELEVHDAVCGTFWYIDPEYAFLGVVTQKSDVYSFGILLFQLLTGKKDLDGMQFNIEDRVDPVVPVEIIDFEEDVESNIEEGIAMNNRVNSGIQVEMTDFEEDSEFNSEEGSVMDIDFEYFPLTAVGRFIEKNNNIMDIADPIISEEHGIEIQQQPEDYWALVKKCTRSKGEERPYMIQVARELSRIHKCFRALPLGQT